MPVYNSWNNKIQLAQLSCNTWKVPIWPSPWIELYKLCSSLIFRQSSLIWPSCSSFTDQLTQEKEKEVYREKSLVVVVTDISYEKSQVWALIWSYSKSHHDSISNVWCLGIDISFLQFFIFFLKMILYVEFDTDMRATGFRDKFLSFRIKIAHFRWSKGTDKRLTLIQKPFVVLRSNLTPHMTMKGALG